MADRSLLHRFFRIAAEHPDRSFLEWRDGDPRRRRSLSYRDADRIVVHLAAEIRRCLPPGAVLVACPPGPEFVVGELALMLARRLPVLVDHLLPPDSLQEVADLFDVRSVYSSPEIFAALSRPGLSHLSPALPEVGDGATLSRENLALLLDEALPEGEETVAHLLLTSGTTGRPKGVPLTHRNLLSNASAILSRGVYADGDRVLGVLPLHHSYPYMVNMLLPLSVAGTAVFSPDLAPLTLREILSQDRISLFPAVPLLWEGFHRRIEEEIGRRPAPVVRLIRGGLIPLSLFLRRRWGINAGRWFFPAVSRTFGPAMKALASGGAPLRPEVVRDFIAMGLVMLEGYGLTETSPVVSMTTPDDLAIGTVGPPLPGVEVRILPAEEGRPGGRVQVRGASVASCYWTGAGKSSPLVDEEGWFDTGDLGRWEEGRLRLVGREKEVLVLPNGKNIFADPLESQLSRVAGVAEAAVLLEGKALVALVRPEETSPPSPEELSARIEAINGHLPSHSRIAAYEVVFEPFPRTRLGKLRRFLLPDLYRAARHRRLARGSADSSRPPDSPLFEKVRALLSRMAGEDVPVVDEARLEADLGFDSLARIELLTEIEEILGREIPEGLLTEITTVGDLREKLSVLAPEGKSPAEEILFRPLSEEEEGKIPPRGRHLRPLTFRERLLYRALRGAGRLFFRIRWPRWRREGEDFCLDDPSRSEGEAIRLGPGPFVIVANHSSYLDGPLLALMLPPELLARTLFWGFAPIFDGPLSAFKNLFGIVSIDPESALSGLRIAFHLLRSGRALGVFPEGERSTDGHLGSFRPGVGTILARMRLPVLCVGIVGAFEALPPHRLLPRPGRIRLLPVALLSPSDYSGLSDAEIVRLLEGRVRALLRG
ncbi:MAG: AMP-binding protein [Leptospirillia bacterium]